MAARFQLGPWLVQPDLNAIVRKGNTIHLTPKVIGVLVCLAEHAGDAVSKEELIRTVWLDTFVTDDVIKGAISELRRAFGDDAHQPRFIETIPKRGYRLIAPVGPADNAEQAQESLQQQTIDFPLASPKFSRARRTIVLTSTIVLTLATVAAAVAFYVNTRKQPIDSIAVLPFVSSDTDPDGQLADGITSGLIESLSQLPELRVMSRNAVLAYKGKQVDAKTAGRELQVRTVLMGTLRASGDAVVLDAELVNASDNSHLWGQKYTTKAADMLTVQSALAEAISAKLRPALSADAKTKLGNPGTSNLEAYALYVKGRYEADLLQPQDWEKALIYFQKAAEKDPAYAQAYAGVGEAYALLAFYRVTPLQEALRNARAAADRALQLNPDLAEGHCAISVAAYIGWQWKQAEQESHRCVELNPNLSFAHQYYSFILGSLNRMDAALAEQRRGVELDPLSHVGKIWLGRAYYLSRDYPRAIAYALKATENDPNDPDLHSTLADSYVMEGQYDKAASEYERQLILEGKEDRAEALRRAYERDGFRGLLEALNQLWGDSQHAEDYCPDQVAGNYALIGDKENAFLWLDKAYADNDKITCGNLLPVQIDPFLDNIRTDPRYKAFLRRMGFPV